MTIFYYIPNYYDKEIYKSFKLPKLNNDKIIVDNQTKDIELVKRVMDSFNENPPEIIYLGADDSNTVIPTIIIRGGGELREKLPYFFYPKLEPKPLILTMEPEYDIPKIQAGLEGKELFKSGDTIQYYKKNGTWEVLSIRPRIFTTRNNPPLTRTGTGRSTLGSYMLPAEDELGGRTRTHVMKSNAAAAAKAAQAAQDLL